MIQCGEHNWHLRWVTVLSIREPSIFFPIKAIGYYPVLRENQRFQLSEYLVATVFRFSISLPYAFASSESVHMPHNMLSPRSSAKSRLLGDFHPLNYISFQLAGQWHRAAMTGFSLVRVQQMASTYSRRGDSMCSGNTSVLFFSYDPMSNLFDIVGLFIFFPFNL